MNENCNINLLKQSLFENPLTGKILTKSDVAKIFRRSEIWVARMTTYGALPAHYVGDEAMYYSEEILDAFISGSLEKRRKHYDKKKNQSQRCDQIRGESEGSRANTLSEIRKFSRS